MTYGRASLQDTLESKSPTCPISVSVFRSIARATYAYQIGRHHHWTQYVLGALSFDGTHVGPA